MNEENEIRTFYIPEWNLENLRKKIERIRKKCAKYGANFHYAEVGEEYRKIKNNSGEEITVKFFAVEAAGTALINGWEFAAVLDHTSAGNIVRALTGVEIPKRFYDCGPFCEHCKTSRYRRNTYLVRNTESGEFFQLGKSCLKDYTFGLSAEMAACYAEFAELLEESASDYGGFTPEQQYYTTTEYLRYVAETIAKFGYWKKGNEYEEPPTAYRASDYMLADHGQISGKSLDRIRREMEKVNFDPEREEIAEQVEKAIAWAESLEEENTYMHNLKLACSFEYCERKNYGILASLFPAYIRAAEQQEREERERKERKKTEWKGEIGSRITVKVESSACMASFGTQFGTMFIYKFLDESGNIYIWKTSKSLQDVTTITGTVKEHGTYKGEKQTELTRCKVA